MNKRFNETPLDDEEKELAQEIESDMYKTVSREEFKKEMIFAKEAATNYLEKNKNINLRLSNGDIQKIKVKAAEAGLPYQTLVASILHQYANEKLEIRI
ncbi:MAG: hypothetical protein Q8P72_04455 [Candidatus Roizmanbacteria bacterium]|nr:hypothetical protein [Candidatus Roizmanbacteria bacterium]